MKTSRRSTTSSSTTLSEAQAPCYYECPHKHFRAPLVDRTQLNPKDHIALLATPRGYRWAGGFPPNYSGPKPFSLLKPTRKKYQADQKKLEEAEQRYMEQFVSQIFPLMSPEMVLRLKRMLVVEFGMTPKKAEEFIKTQNSPSKKNRKSKANKCYEIDANVKGHWLKEFERLLTAKMTDYLVSMFCARRSKKVEAIAQNVLNQIGDITGELCGLDDPRNQVQGIQVFLAERFAVWLATLLDKADNKVCEEYSKWPTRGPEEKKSSSISSTELAEEPTKEEEKIEKVEDLTKEQEDQKPKEAEELKGTEEKEQEGQEPKQEEEKPKEVEELKEESVKGPEEEKPKEVEEKPKEAEEKSKEEEDKLKEGEGKQTTEEEKQKELEEQKLKEEEEKNKEIEEQKEEDERKKELEEQKLKEEEEEKRKKELEEQKLKEEEERKKELEAQQKQKEEEERKKELEEQKQKEEEEEKRKKELEEQKLKEEEERKKELEAQQKQKEEEERKKELEEQKQKEEEERKKELEEQILKEEEQEKELEEQILEEEEKHEAETGKEEDDFEAKEEEKVEEEKKTEDKGGIDESATGDKSGKDVIEEIKDAAKETDAKSVEGGPEKSMGDAKIPEDRDEASAPQLGKSKGAYRIRKDNKGCFYEVQKIDQKEICDRTKIARKKRIAMVPKSICARPKTSKLIKTSKDIKNWSKWATDVANFVENWSDWIVKTTKEMEAHVGDEQPSGYREFKEKTERGVLELKRNKKYIKESSKGWKKKLNIEI